MPHTQPAPASSSTSKQLDRKHRRLRCLLIAIGLYTMIQAIIYGGLAAVALLTHRCAIDVQLSRFGNWIYTTYLARASCDSVNWSLLFDDATPALLPQMPSVTRVAFRTDVFAMVYGAVSVLWLMASVALLSSVSSCGSGRQTPPKRGPIWCWGIVTAAVCLLDLVMSGFHVADLVYSMKEDSFLRHFEIDSAEPFAVPKHMLPGPSAVMLAVSTRLIFFWILNVVLLCCVVPTAFKGLRKYRTSHQPNSPVASRLSQHQTPVDQRQSSYIRTDNIRSEHETPTAPRISVRRTPTPDVVAIPSWLSPVDIRHHKADATRRYDDTAALPSSADEQPTAVYVTPIATKTTIVVGGADTSPPAAQRARTDELRGQLPWSYFKSPNDMMVSRRTFVQLRDDEEMPPVPVPDYTLHFPRRDRPSTTTTTQTNSSEEGVWSGPERRY